MFLSILKISGHSMEPTILNGSKILVSSIPFKFSKPGIGDIIVFRKNQKLIVKRIKDLKGDKVLVSGDNRKDSKDFGWIKRRKILGKIILA